MSPTTDRVLVSDIDGTLLDQGRPTTGLDMLRGALSIMGDRIRLIYATGRTFESTWDLIERGILPVADAIAPLVGTEIWLPPWREPDPGYAELLSRTWDRDRVIELVGGLDELDLQPEEFQGPFKVSFFVRSDTEHQRVEHLLQNKGLAASVVYSGGKFLDIIPKNAGKLAATDHLLERWQIPRESALAAGDSGNDLDMLGAEDLRGVAVGNAEPELAAAAPTADSLYVSVYPYAAGVLEGAKALHFWPSQPSRR